MSPQPAATTVSGGDDKLIGIELLRFASAVAVLVFHYQHFAVVGTVQTNFVASQQPFYSILRLFYSYGYYGVQVFWCISGFIFFWKYGQAISQRRISGYRFFILRWSRLYPLHFATLLIVAALQMVYLSINGAYYIYANNDFYHFVLQLFMASNWGFQKGDSFNGPIWSISIEVLAYCVFFLGLRYVSGSTAFVILMTLLAAAVQLMHISSHPLFTCLMFFYLGGLTAIVYARVNRAARARLLVTGAALAGIAVACALPYFVTVKSMYILPVLSPALIFLCVTYVPSNKFSSGFLVAAGSMTYSSYLLHVPIQLAAATIATYAHLSFPIYHAWFFLAFLGVTLLLSFYCYKYFEIPAQNYLRLRFK